MLRIIMKRKKKGDFERFKGCMPRSAYGLPSQMGAELSGHTGTPPACGASV
jgi:hypothetical protein